jgi:hypothetical protein
LKTKIQNERIWQGNEQLRAIEAGINPEKRSSTKGSDDKLLLPHLSEHQ